MELSIIVVNYNTKDLTLECVESIKKFKPAFPYEIIIVDNGSDEVIPASSNYHLIKNEENVGFAKAVNQGIKKAKGKYVLLLNSDTKVKKGSIDKLVEFGKNHPEAGAVGAKLISPNGSSQGSVFRLPTLFRTIRQYWFNEKELLDKYSPVGDGASRVEAISMAAFLITPAALKKVGNLDERYFMYFEDLDYCRKLKKAGLTIYYLPYAKVIHHHGESGKDLADKKNQWRRLIPSSKIYYGDFQHNTLHIIRWLGQKFGKYIPAILITLLTIPAIYNLLRPGFFLCRMIFKLLGFTRWIGALMIFRFHVVGFLMRGISLDTLSLTITHHYLTIWARFSTESESNI